MTKIRLKHDDAKSVERRHPWLFSGALEPRDLRGLREGELVEVVSRDGTFVACGYYEAGSIAVRVLSFDPEEVVDAHFWADKIAGAYRMRQALGLTGASTAYRLIHGEGDGIPGLIIDVYGSVAVVQAHTMGIHRHRDELVTALTDLPDAHINCVYYKSSGTLTTRTHLSEPLDSVIYGDLPEGLSICENGVTFAPDIVRGQKTGFFLDQRDNRYLVQQYAAGRAVLNVFCYTGGFSLHALKGGATSVTSVDSSAVATAQLEHNLLLNPDLPAGRHHTATEDAFAFLENMPDHAYDLIVLDPPAFAKKRSTLTNGLHGYRRINTRALEKIAPGGLLFTFSCSQALSAEVFRQNIFTSALAAGRSVRVLHQLTQAPDHPVSIYHPEGEYLKGLVLYVE